MAQHRTIRRAALLAAVLGLLGVACEPPDLSLTVNRFSDARDALPGDGICEATAGQGNCTLRAAIDEANATDGTVGISLPAGTYHLTRTGVDDTNDRGDLDVWGHVTITGSGATIAGNADRVFDSTGTLELLGVTVQGGSTTGDGGGIRVRAGTTTLLLATVRANTATGRGGGLALAAGASATLTASTIEGNTARNSGGGLYVAPGATATLDQTTVSGNQVAPVAGGGGGGGQAEPPAGTVLDGGDAGPVIGVPAAPVDDLGRQRVIVEVAAPALPVGTDPATLAQRAAAVEDATEGLVDELEASPDAEAQVERTYSHLPLVALSATPEVIAELEADPAVVRVQVDGLSAPALAQSIPRIGGDAVRAAGATGAGTAIAVIDSGVDPDEPMTAGKVVAEACFAAGPNWTSPGGHCPNGQDTQTGPGAGAPCSRLDLGCWHGTHVASIAAGSPSFGGRVGVASGADLVAVNAGSILSGTQCGAGQPSPCLRFWDSDVLAALNWVYSVAAAHDVVAVNLSLGGGATTTHCDSDVRKAPIDLLRAAGIATVIATGNGGNKNGIGYPSCISTAISVGATLDTADTVAPYSQSAPILDLLAPGTGITAEYPTVPGDPTDYHITANGTSMAAPHVAGAVAVLKAADPGATVAQLETALASTGVPVTDTNGITRPRIDLRKAYALVAARGVGGGIHNGGTLDLTLSTVTTNSAWLAGGIHAAGPTTGAGTIVAGQTAGGDCWTAPGGALTSGGRNLSAGCFAGATDLSGAPLLGALAANGGLVRTHLPQAASPARNAIPPGTPGLCDGSHSHDPRGIVRPQGAGCDIGAAET